MKWDCLGQGVWGRSKLSFHCFHFFFFLLVFSCAEQWRVAPPLIHPKTRKKKKIKQFHSSPPPPNSKSNNSLASPAPAKNCGIALFVVGLPRSFWLLGAGSIHKLNWSAFFLHFMKEEPLKSIDLFIPLFCLHSINWFQQLARLPCGLVACGLQPPLTHPQSTHFSCFHQLIPFSSARTAIHFIHWTVLLGGPPPQTIHQFNHSSH